MSIREREDVSDAIGGDSSSEHRAPGRLGSKHPCAVWRVRSPTDQQPPPLSGVGIYWGLGGVGTR